MHVLFWIAAGVVIGLTLGWASRPVVSHALGSRAAPSAPGAAPDLPALLSGLGDLERRIFTHVLRRKHTSRDTTAQFDAELTFGERLADRIATFGGSWSFISIFLAVLLGWIAYNLERPASFDPYPFILLNLVLSCLAALQAPVIMMSQNRMSAKDRLDARHDYEVNLKAEMEITQLHAKLDELQQRAWRDLIELQERQLDCLHRLERQTGGD
jgi:uncharacterized membrane protein